MRPQKLALFFMTLLCFPALPAPRGPWMRGGLGFLFPDANSFVNGGQVATNRGKSLQGSYGHRRDSQVQDLEASAVWANGKMGIGASIKRSGTDLFKETASPNQVKAQAGLAWGGGKFSLGVIYSNHLESENSDKKNISGQFNFSGGKAGRRWTLGLNAGTTVEGTNETKFGTLGVGRSFGKHFMIEGAYQVDDLSDSTRHYRYTGSVAYLGAKMYAAAQYNLITTPEGNPDQLIGRLGVIVGKVDVSAKVLKETFSGGDISYSGTLRYLF